jgi:hypothetical protein
MKDFFVKVTVPVVYDQAGLAGLDKASHIVQVPEKVSWDDVRSWSKNFSGSQRPAIEMMDFEVYNSVRSQFNNQAGFKDAHRINWEQAKFEYLHSDGSPYDIRPLERERVGQAMARGIDATAESLARQVIDEVEGLYMRVTINIPNSCTGVELVAKATVSTKGVLWDTLKDWLTGRLRWPQEYYIDSRIFNPLIGALVDYVKRTYPVLTRPAIHRVVVYMADVLKYHKDRAKFEWIKFGGEPYDVRPLECQRLKDVMTTKWINIGEDELDPKGVLGPPDLYAECEVILRMNPHKAKQFKRSWEIGRVYPGHQTHEVAFTVRIDIPHDVEWDGVIGWLNFHVGSCFSFGPPYHVTDGWPLSSYGSSVLTIPDPEDAQLINDILRADMPEFRSVKFLRWVHKDGTPYDVRPYERRKVRQAMRRGIGEARQVIDRLVESPEYHIGKPKYGKSSGVVKGGHAYVNSITPEISCNGTIMAGNGARRWLLYSEPLPPEMAVRWHAVQAHVDRCKIANELEKELKASGKLDDVEFKFGQRAKAWIDKNDKNRPQTIRVRRPEEVRLSGPSLQWIKDFRFVRTRANHTSADVMAALINKAHRPGDRVIKVRGEDHPWTYYLLLNPDEEQAFQRQITLSTRQKLSKAMRGEREYES